MAAPELICPSCGAPLKVEDHDETTTHCPFCGTEVILPAELRQAPEVQVINISTRYEREPIRVDARPIPEKSAPKRSFPFIWLALLLLIGFAVPTLLSRYQQAQLSQELEIHQTGTAMAIIFTRTAAPTFTPLPTITPTPQFASPVLSFGQAGIGAGMFNRAGHIAADGQGNLYVADYEGGRIQRFDQEGKYLSQWRVGNSQTFIHGMSADYNGTVYVAYDEQLEVFEGSSGRRLKQLAYPQEGEFGSLAVTSDGRLAAMWYEGRWGLITSIEGHREELVIYNSAGEIEQQFPNIISGQTDSLALDVTLAVDGAGTIYALSDGVIFQFSPEGKFVDRINHLGDQTGQYRSANNFTVDGQGRLYMVDGQQISVYSSDQSFVDSFTSPEYIESLVITPDGGIWGTSETQVIRFGLR